MLQYSKKTIIILLMLAVVLYIAAIIYSYSYKHSESFLVLKADSNTELVINAKNADIIIDRGSNSGISIRGLRTKELTHEESLNTHRIGAFSKGLLKDRKIVLRVTLPDNAIKKLSISTDIGDIAINNADAQYIAIALANGDIDIENTNGDIAIKSSGGNIKLIDTTSSKIEIDSKAGDIEAIGIKADAFDIAATTGDVYASPLELKNFNVNIASGDIELDLEEEPGLIEWNTKSGTFYINEEEAIGAKAFVGRGALSVKASSTSGDLELNY